MLSFLQSKYNDLMTQGDKDFITRIQVTQLVTQDPYAEDFYAQSFMTNQQRQMQYGGGFASGQKHQKVLSFGEGGGVGIAQNTERRSGRRENALIRMQNQIERVINLAKSREKSPSGQCPFVCCGCSALNILHQISANLQGALGKISGRSYKVAPRQLLQVDQNESSAEVRQGAAKEAADIGRAALADAAQVWFLCFNFIAVPYADQLGYIRSTCNPSNRSRRARFFLAWKSSMISS